MKEIQQIVNDKVKSMTESGAIQSVIEESVEKAIESAINQQFQSYGNITKQINKALEEGLQINPSNLDLPSYNQQMAVAVKTRIGNLFAGQASERFMREIDRVLEPAPPEISMRELIETICGFWKPEDHYSVDDVDEYATVEFEKSKYGCYDLKIWKKKESSHCSRGEDVHLYISKEDQIRISFNQQYNPTCFRDHEAFVFKLYAAGTKITGLEGFDPDDCDLNLKDGDY